MFYHPIDQIYKAQDKHLTYLFCSGLPSMHGLASDMWQKSPKTIISISLKNKVSFFLEIMRKWSWENNISNLEITELNYKAQKNILPTFAFRTPMNQHGLTCQMWPKSHKIIVLLSWKNKTKQHFLTILRIFFLGKQHLWSLDNSILWTQRSYYKKMEENINRHTSVFLCINDLTLGVFQTDFNCNEHW